MRPLLLFKAMRDLMSCYEFHLSMMVNSWQLMEKKRVQADAASGPVVWGRIADFASPIAASLSASGCLICVPGAVYFVFRGAFRGVLVTRRNAKGLKSTLRIVQAGKPCQASVCDAVSRLVSFCPR